MATRRRRTTTRRRTGRRRTTTTRARVKRRTAAGRASLAKNYAYPGGVSGSRKPAYPTAPANIYAGLSYSAHRNTGGTYAGYRRALVRRYGSYEKALAAARRSRASRRGR